MRNVTTTVLSLVTGSTGLYAPGASGGEALFLLWTPGAQATLSITSLWADSGVPADPGWFIFLAGPVGQANAAAVEAALRKGLGETRPTGIAWADVNGGIACAVPIECRAGAAPSVAADATLPTPAGLLALSFAAGTPLRSVGDFEGLAASAPPKAGPVLTGSDGATVWIQGERAGCATFQALAGQDPAADATVTLMEVSLDPLRPFDPSRSFQTFTGMSYGFTADAAGRWQLVALEDGTE